MITKNNLKDVLKLLSFKDIKRINNTDKEYIVLYLHTFNTGSVLSIRLTNDFNRYKNVSYSGNCILYVDDVKNLKEVNK